MIFKEGSNCNSEYLGPKNICTILAARYCFSPSNAFCTEYCPLTSDILPETLVDLYHKQTIALMQQGLFHYPNIVITKAEIQAYLDQMDAISSNKSPDTVIL